MHVPSGKRFSTRSNLVNPLGDDRKSHQRYPNTGSSLWVGNVVAAVKLVLAEVEPVFQPLNLHASLQPLRTRTVSLETNPTRWAEMAVEVPGIKLLRYLLLPWLTPCGGCRRRSQCRVVNVLPTTSGHPVLGVKSMVLLVFACASK